MKWAAIGGIVLGFLGVMKISGNLNREFFAEILMMVPPAKTHPLHQEQQDAESTKKSVSSLLIYVYEICLFEVIVFCLF